MNKSTAEYADLVRQLLHGNNSYNEAFEPNIIATAGVLRTLVLANKEIDELESTTITTSGVHGERKEPHPVFKTYRDACESLRKQMEALGLSWSDINTVDEADPLYELTKAVANVGITTKKVKPTKRK